MSSRASSPASPARSGKGATHQSSDRSLGVADPSPSFRSDSLTRVIIWRYTVDKRSIVPPESPRVRNDSRSGVEASSCPHRSGSKLTARSPPAGSGRLTFRRFPIPEVS